MSLKRSVVCGVVGALAFLVVAAPAAVACETSSWITTDPSSGPPGTKVTVTGAGFEPGIVMFRWDRSAESGGQVLGETTVGEDGTVVAEVTVPETSSGAHKVVAEHASSSETVAHADAWSDFHVPGAAPENSGKAGSEDATEGSSASSDSDPATGQREVSDPVTTTSAIVETAQPISRTTTLLAAEEARPARDVGSDARVPQLARHLRAVDIATYPVAMEEAPPAANGRSRVPDATRSLVWEDLRWIAAAIAAMTAGLFMSRRAKRRAPEPEGPVVELLSGGRAEEEADRAA